VVTTTYKLVHVWLRYRSKIMVTSWFC